MKVNKACCCLSLAKGCFLLGLLDLASNIYLTVDYSMLIHNNTSNNINFEVISTLVIIVIAILTCSLMMYGSMMENRWLLLPHLVWEIILMGLFIMGGVTGIITGQLTSTAVLWCSLLLCIYYWIVMYSRYSEIKRKQSTPPDLIEME